MPCLDKMWNPHHSLSHYIQSTFPWPAWYLQRHQTFSFIHTDSAHLMLLMRTMRFSGMYRCQLMAGLGWRPGFPIHQHSTLDSAARVCGFKSQPWNLLPMKHRAISLHSLCSNFFFHLWKGKKKGLHYLPLTLIAWIQWIGTNEVMPKLAMCHYFSTLVFSKVWHAEMKTVLPQGNFT